MLNMMITIQVGLEESIYHGLLGMLNMIITIQRTIALTTTCVFARYAKYRTSCYFPIDSKY